MITKVAELQDWSRRQHAEGRRIGLVPTMGALHEGHLSLVRAANEHCDSTVVSIFVNPTQFGPHEDFHRYPRPLENDLKLLETVGSPEIFVPDVEEMYPEGFDVSVHVGGVTQSFEGRSRPTHFAGVATIVLKLFMASGADAAFFGQKDYQQAGVIRKMVADLNIPTEIVVCPIIRESDGLAMSSRNRYLSDSQRVRAASLSISLEAARKMIVEEKVRDVETVRAMMRKIILASPEAEIDTVIDYVALADPATLREIDEIDRPEIVVLLAVRIGTTRLIDNALISTV